MILSYRNLQRSEIIALETSDGDSILISMDAFSSKRDKPETIKNREED